VTAEPPLLLTLTETAALLGIGKTLAYEMAANRRLPVIRIGRLVRVPRADLVAWIAAETRYPVPPDTSAAPTRRAVGRPLTGPARRIGNAPVGPRLRPVPMGLDPADGSAR